MTLIRMPCASARRESRGLHFTIDHPKKDAAWVRDTVVRVGEGGWPTVVAPPRQ